MTGLMPVLSQPWAQALAWTLIHFLWQGALIGLAAWVVLRTTRLSSSARYGIGVAAMAAMLAAPLLTFAIAMSGPGAAAVASVPDAPAAPASVATPIVNPNASHTDVAIVAPPAASVLYLRLVLLAWTVGVLVLSARLLGGWIVARRLARRALRPVSPDVHVLARRVAGRIALDRFVRFFESTAVAVPVTVGWLRPVVLLPASAMSGLSPTQIEALLAHELAHVRRHDYLVNLLQSAVETLLFYHPAVWWASRVVRVEREHCCDDVAVGVCDRLTYVSALSDLAAMNAAPRMAMAASGGSLLARVRRLLGQPSDDGLAASWVPAILVALLAVAIVPVLVAQSTGSGSSQGRAGTGAGASASGGEGRAVAVAGGVATGVQGGVAVGTRSGVNSAVVGGVSQGVRGGVAQIDQGRPVRRAEAERLVELERAIAELATRLRRSQADIERERAMVALQSTQEQSKVQREAINSEIQAAIAELEQVRARVAVGVANPSAQREAERHVAELQRHLQERELEQRHRMRDLELALRATDLRREHATELAELERALVEMRGRMADEGVLEQRRHLEARLADVARELEGRAGMTQRETVAVQEAAREIAEAQAAARAAVADASLLDERRLAGTTVLTDASATAEARDVLVIRISGENGLPTAYTVDTAGNIRLPLVGTLQVRGLTAAQVRTAVTNLLADRQLARDATISVELRRPRSPD